MQTRFESESDLPSAVRCTLSTCVPAHAAGTPCGRPAVSATWLAGPRAAPADTVNPGDDDEDDDEDDDAGTGGGNIDPDDDEGVGDDDEDDDEDPLWAAASRQPSGDIG